MLSHNFEKYHGGDIRPPRGDIWVSLSRQSQFYLNKKAFEVLGSPEAVSLYFSREDAAIAIEPAFPSFHENLRVRRGMNGYHISAPVSYTHLDVYKRQIWILLPIICLKPAYRTDNLPF